jgi:CubicO group peptidase (beta-lactamase class C family)
MAIGATLERHDMSIKATQFLEQKLRETLAECHVPALAAALVRDSGDTVVSAAQGIRKVGASGAANAIQPSDKFNLGSISKVITGTLMARLIQGNVGNLAWSTKLGDVFPQLWFVPAARDGYKHVTLEQMLAHTAGFPYTPANDDVNDWMGYTPLDMTKSKLKTRRLAYVLNSLLDAPSYWPPTTGFEYSGGGIIAASMAEKKTGKLYEDLVKEYVYTPLGMTNSGFGILSSGALSGPWQHRWDDEDRTISADNNTHLPGFNWGARAPVGSACCSAADMGKFMREHLRPDPQVLSTPMRSDMQTHEVSTHSDFVRGAWASSDPGSASAEIWHNGDNGVSYAHMSVHPSQGIGFAAMSNMNSKVSSGAVHEMHEVMSTMHVNWNALFGPGSPDLVECVHPVPALAFTGSTLWAFGRRHDGGVHRYKSTNHGATFNAMGDFGPVRINSGLGAAVSADGQRLFVIGRGLDDKAWFGWSSNGGSSWQGWVPILAGVFISGIAIACNAAGTIVHAVGIGQDRRMWRAHSTDGGQNWTGWTPIGQGVFTSGPAIACSTDGKVVHVVARGNDLRAWRNVSSDTGMDFQPHWAPVGKGVFGSGLGLACNDSGQRVTLMGRGFDKSMWTNFSTNSGTSWQAHWKKVDTGTFTSAPVLATRATGMHLHAYAYGGDFRVWGNRSTDGGATWSGWGQKTSDFFI